MCIAEPATKIMARLPRPLFSTAMALSIGLALTASLAATPANERLSDSAISAATPTATAASDPTLAITLNATVAPTTALRVSATAAVTTASAKRKNIIKAYVTKLTKGIPLAYKFTKGLCGATVCGAVSFVALANTKLASFKTPTMRLDATTSKYSTTTHLTKLGKVVLAHEAGHVVQAKVAQLRFDGINGLRKWLKKNGFSGSKNMLLEKAADAMAYAATGKPLGAYLHGKPNKKQLAAAKQLWKWAAE